jgi:hypothetical protein
LIPICRIIVFREKITEILGNFHAVKGMDIHGKCGNSGKFENMSLITGIFLEITRKCYSLRG